MQVRCPNRAFKHDHCLVSPLNIHRFSLLSARRMSEITAPAHIKNVCAALIIFISGWLIYSSCRKMCDVIYDAAPPS
uniref:Uncharacterized protein n=1 Tax=Anguilla anguilla TaxID=7936 RepID=A0A0E9V530_ANGAN